MEPVAMAQNPTRSHPPHKTHSSSLCCSFLCYGVLDKILFRRRAADLQSTPILTRGRMKGISDGGEGICFGRYALQVLEPAWITARQIEAGRRAITRNVHRGGGKVWARAFAHKTVTARPAETRMGRGKGGVKYSVAVVQPGKILYEMGGVAENIARKAVSIAASKMPVRTRFIVDSLTPSRGGGSKH